MVLKERGERDGYKEVEREAGKWGRRQGKIERGKMEGGKEREGK